VQQADDDSTPVLPAKSPAKDRIVTLPNAYLLANDSEFRVLAGFSLPPRAGRITAILGSGQVTVEMDDPDGGDVTAWPLNGFTYTVDDLVYVLFASNSPDSGIVVGSRSLEPASLGTTTIAARDSNGLSLTDDAGNLGVHVEDGGQVGINNTNPAATLDVTGGIHAGNATGVTGATGRITISGTSGELDIQDRQSAAWSVTDRYVIYNNADILRIYRSGDLVVIDSSGRVGIGAASPQGPLHAYKSPAGFLHWSHAAVSNTAQTILPDGTGDVVYRMTGLVVIENGGASVATVLDIANGANQDIVVGAGTWRFAVAASGALTVARVSGSGTARIALLITWL
jgi:hypothetical protein